MVKLVAALLLAGSMVGVSAQTGTAPPDRPAFEAELQFSAAGELFRAIQANYPDEYRVLIDQYYDVAAARPADRPALAAAGKRLVDALYKRHARALSRAPAPLLVAINGRQLALIRRLARDDTGLCAQFAGTLFIGRLDLPSAYQQEAAALAASILEAAKAGDAAPPGAARTGLSEGDASAWYSRLLELDPSGEILSAAMAADDGTGTPEIQCRVGAAVYASIEKLEPEQAANVAAFLLTQTLADAG